jgi:hypothetical protein
LPPFAVDSNGNKSNDSNNKRKDDGKQQSSVHSDEEDDRDSFSVGSMDEGDDYGSDVDVVGTSYSADEEDGNEEVAPKGKSEPRVTVTVPAPTLAAKEEKKLTPPPSPDRRTAKAYRASYLSGLGGVLDKDGYLETSSGDKRAADPGHAHLFTFIFNRSRDSSFRAIYFDMYSPDFHRNFKDEDGTNRNEFEREPFAIVRRITGLDFCDNLSQFLSAIASIYEQSEDYQRKNVSAKRIQIVQLSLNHSLLAYELVISCEGDRHGMALVVGHQQLGQAFFDAKSKRLYK